MSTRRVTLLSNSLNSKNIISEFNDPAEFVAELPTGLLDSQKRWQVNMDNFSFRALFANVKRLEKYGPHIVAWHCYHFTDSNICSNFDPEKPETFPSDREIRSTYNVKECRLNDGKRFGSVSLFVNMLNNIINWDVGFEKVARRITYSRTSTGLKIEGDGEVVLLLSSALTEWIGLENFPIVLFGSQKYSLLDFSKGRRTDGSNFSIRGNVSNMLTSHRVEPSHISVWLSFGKSSWRENCIGMVSYTSPSTANKRKKNHSGDHHYFHKSLDNVEPAFIEVGEDLQQVKIRLADQNGDTLRLINNLYLPTLTSLTFRQIPSEKMRRNFVIRMEGKIGSELMRYCKPTMPNYKGKLQVALQSIFLPPDIDWIEDNDPNFEIHIQLPDRLRTLIQIPSIAFRSSQSLIEYLDAFKRVTSGGAVISTEGLQGKMRLTVLEGTVISMSRKLATVLGLDNVHGDDDWITIAESITSIRTVDVTRIFPSFLAVHCSIIKPSILGNTVTNVLEVIPTSGRSGSEGELMAYEARKPAFFDIQRDHVSDFVISLKTVEGQPIRFQRANSNDLMYVNLLFKDKK